MSLRRIAVSVVIVAVMSGCGHDHSAVDEHGPQRTDVSDGTGETVFAFSTASQLSLVRGDVIAVTAATLAEPRYPVFTASGRFVAAATDDGQIVAIGLDPTASRTIPANADRVFPGGGDSIAWWERPNQLATLDLSDPSSVPVKKAVDLPGGTTPATRLLSMANGVTVFARPLGGGSADSREELITMNNGQAFHSLGPSPDRDPIRAAFPSADGRKLAYLGLIHAACPKDAVGVVDSDTGAASSPELPYSIDDRATVRNIWWESDGLLYMSLAVKPCIPTSERPERVTTWKLVEGKWVPADPADALVSRRLGGDAVATVTPTSSAPPMGSLWIVNGQNRRHAADNVTDLAAPSSTDHSQK